MNVFYQIVHATGTFGAAVTSTNAIVWGGTNAAFRDTTVPVGLQKLKIE